MTDTNNYIHINEDQDIIELITELSEKLKQGYVSVNIKSEIVGDGNTESGANEFEWNEYKLIFSKY